MKLYYIIFISFIVVSCNENKTFVTKNEIKIENKFEDENIQKIYSLLDHRQSDSLIVYFTHNNPIYRAESANAFATIQDSTYLNELHRLLNDSVSMVQQKAAWAIGQIKNHNSVIPLTNSLSKVSKLAKTEILEAIGKCANENDILFFENFKVTNDNALGFSKSIYHFAYKNSLPPLLLKKNIKLISTVNNDITKMFLAGTISRGKPPHLIDIEQQLIDLINIEKNTEVLLSLYQTAGKIVSKTMTRFLENKIRSFNENIPDYRVIVAVLTAYSRQKTTSWKVFKTYLSHANENIGLAASRCLKNSNYSPIFHPETNVLKNQYSAQVDAVILGYSLNKTKDTRWLQTIQYKYRNASNYLNKSFYLRTLKSEKNQAKWIEDKMINEGHPIIKTAAAETLVEMKKNDLIPDNMDFSQTIKAGFMTNDVGVLATFSMHIADSNMKYKEDFFNTDLLDIALSQLTLPKDIETYNEIQKAKSTLSGETYSLKTVQFNNPIDWDFVKNITKNQKAIVLTNKGKIEINLDVENAPGSVSNFIKLANKGFFNNKPFHRVVPNFVVQTGCTRGDGYGSLNYTIRSEFSLHNYSTGAVGMASAGKDTESCQWFITHTPTPFLEGRYSIFGYVNDIDLLTLHQLSMDDKIISVSIK